MHLTLEPDLDDWNHALMATGQQIKLALARTLNKTARWIRTYIIRDTAAALKLRLKIEVGEQVILIAPSGELTQALIIGALNQNKYPAISHTSDCHCIEYGNGTKVSYDRNSHCIDLGLTANGKIQLTAVTVGSLIVDGNIIVDSHYI